LIELLGHGTFPCKGEQLRSTAAVDALRERITW
jgi:hypothetical protein